MNILGIVVEYNPFHYGHYYHLHTSIKKAKADITIAVMSGSFLQRGEPAITDKWARTQMALHNGVDLVIELPYIYSTQKAEIFSDGAVSILDSIGVNHLCFGSEYGEIGAFLETVDKVNEHEDELDSLIQKNIRYGVSYPKAFSNAFKTLFQTEKMVDLSQPNNILGYHYVKSIKKLSSPITPLTIQREKANFHDTFFIKGEKIASATSIRKNLIVERKQINEIYDYLPKETFDQLSEHKKKLGKFTSWELYFPYIQHQILTASATELSYIYECEEGIEHRLKKMIMKASSFHELMELVKTKRYTWTRIQRLFVHILMNTTKEFMKAYCTPLNPPYIRVLGMTDEGRAYLSAEKKRFPIPLITRAKEYDHPVLEKDTLASQIHSLPFSKEHSLQQEYKAIPIQYNKNLHSNF
ncbi:nucleotidyltransferase [Evansella sp. AB-P1]|uniref:nucleotidyltransferase n=1 Tax=Evansella sp. AB-P1 TaxID=3037653 RepID=UPI00241F028C|nr:nucleotidyltransferase [Evansella sp. AB-P1]MDG5788307.1 nucleotidyltransferase [Evansella sp. AB-P1]